MRWGFRHLRALLVGLGIAALIGVPFLGAQQLHRNRFEGHNPSWVKGNADLAFDETAHAMSDQGSHDGQRSEFIQINAKQQGSFVHYLYSPGKAPTCWSSSSRRGWAASARWG